VQLEQLDLDDPVLFPLRHQTGVFVHHLLHIPPHLVAPVEVLRGPDRPAPSTIAVVTGLLLLVVMVMRRLASNLFT